MKIKKETLEDIRESLAQALVKALACQLPDHWSVLTEVFPYLDRGIAADLMSLVRTTKLNRTNGDFLLVRHRIPALHPPAPGR